MMSKNTNNPESLVSGALAQHLFQTMPLGVVAFDTQLNITDSNPFADSILHPCSNIADALAAGYLSNQKLAWDTLLYQALASDDPFAFENFNYSKNNVSRLLHIICTPLTSKSGSERLGGILLIEDVTAKVMMERDLASSERLAAVGKLAAKVAHELNNPLDGIMRYINMALRLMTNSSLEQPARYLQESRKGLLRMVTIISELLEFSRSTYSAMEEADINKIVEDAVKAMNSQAENNSVNIIRLYSKNMPNIRSGNLFQVFCNLIKNAIDAMPSGGEIVINTTCDDHRTQITFADTGTGMPPEVEKKLFEPFFTTKDTGKGTGLGLAICKEIIERYNGHLNAENRPEGGCLFTVTIPLESTRQK